MAHIGAINGLPGGKGLGRGAPLATGFSQIENGIYGISGLVFTAVAIISYIKVFLDKISLFIVEVAGVFHGFAVLTRIYALFIATVSEEMRNTCSKLKKRVTRVLKKHVTCVTSAPQKKPAKIAG